MELIQMKQRMEQFFEGHPKVRPFFHAVSRNAVKEGSVIEVKVTPPDGDAYESNIRLSAQDVDTIRMLMQLAGR